MFDKIVKRKTAKLRGKKLQVRLERIKLVPGKKYQCGDADITEINTVNDDLQAGQNSLLRIGSYRESETRRMTRSLASRRITRAESRKVTSTPYPAIGHKTSHKAACIQTHEPTRQEKTGKTRSRQENIGETRTSSSLKRPESIKRNIKDLIKFETTSSTSCPAITRTTSRTEACVQTCELTRQGKTGQITRQENIRQAKTGQENIGQNYTRQENIGHTKTGQENIGQTRTQGSLKIPISINRKIKKLIKVERRKRNSTRPHNEDEDDGDYDSEDEDEEKFDNIKHKTRQQRMQTKTRQAEEDGNYVVDDDSDDEDEEEEEIGNIKHKTRQQRVQTKTRQAPLHTSEKTNQRRIKQKRSIGSKHSRIKPNRASSSSSKDKLKIDFIKNNVQVVIQRHEAIKRKTKTWHPSSPICEPINQSGIISNKTNGSKNAMTQTAVISIDKTIKTKIFDIDDTLDIINHGIVETNNIIDHDDIKETTNIQNDQETIDVKTRDIVVDTLDIQYFDKGSIDHNVNETNTNPDIKDTINVKIEDTLDINDHNNKKLTTDTKNIHIKDAIDIVEHDIKSQVAEDIRLEIANGEMDDHDNILTTDTQNIHIKDAIDVVDHDIKDQIALDVNIGMENGEINEIRQEDITSAAISDTQNIHKRDAIDIVEHDIKSQIAVDGNFGIENIESNEIRQENNMDDAEISELLKDGINAKYVESQDCIQIKEELDEQNNEIQDENYTLSPYLEVEFDTEMKDSHEANDVSFSADIKKGSDGIPDDDDDGQVSSTEDLETDKPKQYQIRKKICQYCSKPFPSQALLNKHVRNKHITCHVCDTTFKDKVSLARHREIHLYTETCSFCKKIFKNKYVWKSHMQSHSDAMLTCNYCKDKFKDFTELGDHLSTHLRKSFVCYICSEDQCNRGTLVNHIVTHILTKPYICYCGKKFQLKHNLREHLTVIHKIGDKPYVCNFCKGRFADQLLLNVHVRKHVHGKHFACDSCAKTFSTKQSFNYHFRNHVEIPFAFRESLRRI